MSAAILIQWSRFDILHFEAVEEINVNGIT